jgi:hypothetical protein
MSPAIDYDAGTRNNYHLPLAGNTYLYFTNTQARLISQAFEVNNTSNALNTGGQCIAFRHPQNIESGHLTVTDTVTTPSGRKLRVEGLTKIFEDHCKIAKLDTKTPREVKTDSDDENKETGESNPNAAPYAAMSGDAIMMTLPPSSVSQASQLQTSMPLSAKEGVYICNHLQSVENKFESADQRIVLFAEDSPSTLSVTENNAWVGLADFAGNLGKYPTSLRTYFDSTGAYFSGLDKEASLTVKFTRIIEITPNANSGFRLLVQPAPSYDIEALMTYVNVVSKLPVACPWAENGFGEWWRKVLSVVSKVRGVLTPFAKPLMGALDVASAATGLPIGPAVRGFYNGAATIGDTITDLTRDMK